MEKDESTSYALMESPSSASSQSTHDGDDEGSLLSMEEVRALSGLNTISPQKVFSIFSHSSSQENGSLSRADIGRGFDEILPIRTEEQNQVVDQIFELFNHRENETVDFNELASGLSILCGGTQNDKVVAAFSLFDTNGDGYICKAEMQTYLTSVYKMIFALQSHDHLQVSPEDLAKITTEDAFSQVDRNEDERLTLEEFTEWYSSNSQSNQETLAKAQQPQRPTVFTLDEMRHLTTLESRNPMEVFGIFAEGASEEGVLSRTSFNHCFREIIGEVASLMTASQQERAGWIIDTMFDIFDLDGNGTVDFVELSSGLTVLCGGTKDEKIDSVFRLYDINEDGFIYVEELVMYLSAVFKTLYTTNPELQQTITAGGIDPLHLAKITATQAFDDADVNQDGRLSFEEFKRWYMASNFFATDDEAEEKESGAPSAMVISPDMLFSMNASLNEVRRITNLHHYKLKDIFDFFSASANTQGQLSKSQFFRCFNKLLLKANTTANEGSQASANLNINTNEVKSALDRLFTLFDTSMSGTVDITELAAGLTLLCGGKSSEKMHAVFGFYDQNQDGTIHKHEMELFLTALFKVLFSSSSALAQALDGISPQQMAQATTEQCFQDCDMDQNEKLSYEEFEHWYQHPQNPFRIEYGSKLPTPLASTEASAPPVSASESLLSPASELTTTTPVSTTFEIANWTIEFLLDVLVDAADENGYISKTEFLRVIPQKKAEVQSMKVLFQALDKKDFGMVDFQELASGLSILCGQSSTENPSKVAQIFSLFDRNGDGLITLPEMATYLTSVFTIMFALQQAPYSITSSISPEELANITAVQAFEEAGTDALDWEAFEKWYLDTSPRPATIEKPSSTPVSVKESVVFNPSPILSNLRRWTNLGKYSVDEMISFIQTKCGPEKGLTRPMFLECFSTILGQGDDAGSSNFLFDLFDSDRNGIVDQKELISGLSILCKGTRASKLQLVFNVFDLNNDGYISPGEMVVYFAGIFRLFQSQLPVSPEEMAHATMSSVFQEADLNQDGKLSVAEFTKWYLDVPATQFPNSVEEMKQKTRLGLFFAEDIFELFAEKTDDEGFIPREGYNACFQIILHTNLSGSDSAHDIHDYDDEDHRAEIKQLIDSLFHLFDTQGLDKIEFSEIASGVSILCRGSRRDKIQAAFALFDYNGDGVISLDEITQYFSSVFRLLYAILPRKAFEEFGVSSTSELAHLTAEQAMTEADLDGDGKLTLEEFQAWYTQDTTYSMVHSGLTLAQAKHVTQLHLMRASEVFEQLAKRANAAGQIHLEAFLAFFRTHREKVRENHNEEDESHFVQVIRRLFDSFDSDGNGVVDLNEMASGLSTMCRGSPLEKIEAAFALVDTDGDGSISLDEMTRYLTSVFRVLDLTSPEVLMKLHMTPEELGQLTATEAFASADANEDGRLSQHEFMCWYTSSNAQVMEHAGVLDDRDDDHDNNNRSFRLANLQKCTGLHLIPASRVFEVLAEDVDTRGCLDRKSFCTCIRTLCLDTRQEENPDFEKLVHRLFSIFGSLENDTVDFSTLAAGVSILCGGSEAEKVQAIFALYDYNDDGVLRFSDMTSYLSSVFRLLIETSSVAKLEGISAPELAQMTAKRAFEQLDVDKNGTLTLGEFQSWYASTNHSSLMDETLLDMEDAPSISSFASSSSSTSDERNITPPASVVDLETPEPRFGPQKYNHERPSETQHRIRRLLKLDAFSVTDVLAIFAEAAPNNRELTAATFFATFETLVELGGGHANEMEAREASVVMSRLFRSFDTNEDEVIDFAELTSGLSILSSSSLEDKILAAFDLYDTNDDGYISLEDMTRYMRSVFKVMAETTDVRSSRELGLILPSPEKLARITAQECFEEADTNRDGKVNFQEFRAWCTASLVSDKY